MVSLIDCTIDGTPDFVRSRVYPACCTDSILLDCYILLRNPQAFLKRAKIDVVRGNFR